MSVTITAVPQVENCEFDTAADIVGEDRLTLFIKLEQIIQRDQLVSDLVNTCNIIVVHFWFAWILVSANVNHRF